MPRGVLAVCRTPPHYGAMEQASYERPFAGITVVDFSQGMAGPGCGLLLAAHGARVIKVEPPQGDWARHLGTRHGAHAAMEMAVNRGKSSLALDLKQPPGVEVAGRLLETADVMIASFRPGAGDRLGLGYAAMRARNPRLLYVAISGFGQDGPYAERPATDMVAQAYSGIMAINRGADGRPLKVGFVLVDTAASMFAFQAVATSLYARRDEGRLIDVNLMQAAARLIAPKIVEGHLEGEQPRPLNAPGGAYRTSDGWIAITMMREEQYRDMCRVLGRPDLAEDPRFDSPEKRADALDVLMPMLNEAVRRRTSAEWLEELAAADVLCSEINGIGDWLGDEHVAAVDAAPLLAQQPVGVVPVPRVPGLPEEAIANLAEGSPGHGEHGGEILRGLGYSEARIAELAAAGVVVL